MPSWVKGSTRRWEPRLGSSPSPSSRGCILKSVTPVIPVPVSPIGWSALTFLLLLPLLVASLRPSLVAKLSQFLQQRVLGNSLLELVQASGQLQVETVNIQSRPQGRQHVVHGHVRAKVLNAHHYLDESFNKVSQRLSLLLADTNQGNGGQVVQSALGKLVRNYVN